MCLFGWSHKGAEELRLKSGILTKHVKRAQGGILLLLLQEIQRDLAPLVMDSVDSPPEQKAR